jgi:putative tricarboxylic transport membrane protein
VFSLNNSVFDIWVMLGFGVVGYAMMRLGFPLAPMILGVVLGPIAETNLSRSLATSSDLSLFVLRPWAMFFVLLAAFSVIFPWYQAARGAKRWTAFYMPALCMALAAPLLLMQGLVRPLFGALLLALGGWLIWSRALARGVAAP